MADLLPADVWRFIGCKLDSTGDRIRFRAVCKSWRSALPFRQPPWLMLAAGEPKIPMPDDESEAEAEAEPTWLMVLHPEFSPDEVILPRGFVCLGDQTIHRIHFPEIDEARVVGSTDNWLITMHLDKTMRLSNPFTRLQFQLPSFTTFRYGGLSRPTPYLGEVLIPTHYPPESYRDGLVWKVVLSSAPSDRDCIAMAVHFAWYILGIARPGDASWTTVQIAGSPMTYLGVEDMIFYKDQFYAVTELGRLMVCDIGDGDVKPPMVSFVSDPLIEVRNYKQKIYLVECAGELLMVSKHLNSPSDLPEYSTDTFNMYKFDFLNNKFERLMSVGEYSLFLGFNASTSVLASDYFGLVRKNCIYFTDDHWFGFLGQQIPGGHDMGVFDLEDGSITPHFKGTSTSLHSPPVWIIPLNNDSNTGEGNQ